MGVEIYYLCGNVNCTVWDVQVPNDEDEAGCHDGRVWFGGFEGLNSDA
jgi:hypothetical protein